MPEVMDDGGSRGPGAVGEGEFGAATAEPGGVGGGIDRGEALGEEGTDDA